MFIVDINLIGMIIWTILIIFNMKDDAAEKKAYKEILFEIIKNLKEEQQERRDNLMLVYTEYLIDDFETEEMKTIHWSVNGIDKKLVKLFALEERLEKL